METNNRITPEWVATLKDNEIFVLVCRNFVTPIGCGGGCRRPGEIAPMFRDVAKLPNVSLPQEFWDILNR